MSFIKSGGTFAIIETGSFKKCASIVSIAKKEKSKDIVIEEKGDDFLYFVARAITADVPNGNYDMFPAEEIKASYQTFVGKGFYLDHNSDSIDKAFGTIIDAVYVDKDSKDVHVQCLMKINKKQFPDICQKVIDGVLNSVSMGAIAQESVCSICGNVAHDKDQFCKHISGNKGRKFRVEKDATGNIINAEVDDLGDQVAFEINKGLVFTELSGVTVPADSTARVKRVWADQVKEKVNKLIKMATRLFDKGLVQEATDLRRQAEDLEKEQIIDSIEEEDVMNDEIKKEEPKKEEVVIVQEKPGTGFKPENLARLTKEKITAAEYESLENEILNKTRINKVEVPEFKPEVVQKPVENVSKTDEITQEVLSKLKTKVISSLFKHQASDLIMEIDPNISEEEKEKILNNVQVQIVEDSKKVSSKRKIADNAVNEDVIKTDKETNPVVYDVKFVKNPVKVEDSQWVVEKDGTELLSAKLKYICGKDGDVEYYTSPKYAALTERIIHKYGLGAVRDRWSKLAADAKVQALTSEEVSKIKEYFSKVFGKIDKSYFPELIELHKKKEPEASNVKLASLKTDITASLSILDDISVEDKVAYIKASLDTESKTYKESGLKDLATQCPDCFEKLFVLAKGKGMSPDAANAMWKKFNQSKEKCMEGMKDKMKNPSAFCRWLEVFVSGKGKPAKDSKPEDKKDEPQPKKKFPFKRKPIENKEKSEVAETEKKVDEKPEEKKDEGTEFKALFAEIEKDKENQLKEIIASEDLFVQEGETKEQAAERFYNWLKDKATETLPVENIETHASVEKKADEVVPEPVIEVAKEEPKKEEVVVEIKEEVKEEPKVEVKEEVEEDVELIKKENELLKKEKKDLEEKMASEKMSKLFDDKKNKCYAVVEEMVDKGLVVADEDNVREMVNNEDCATIEEARKKDFKDRVDKQLAKLMSLDEKGLTAFADTVKSFKVVAGEKKETSGSVILAGLGFTPAVKDIDGAFLDRVFSSKYRK